MVTVSMSSDSFDMIKRPMVTTGRGPDPPPLPPNNPPNNPPAPHTRGAGRDGILSTQMGRNKHGGGMSDCHKGHVNAGINLGRRKVGIGCLTFLFASAI